jgi:integrase/recombinase XerC
MPRPFSRSGPRSRALVPVAPAAAPPAPAAAGGGALSDPRAGGAALTNAFLAGKSPETLRAYRKALADFAGFLRDKKPPVDAAGPDEAASHLISLTHGHANAVVLEYRNTMIDSRGLLNNTVNVRLSAIKSLIKLARMHGVIQWAIDVPNLPQEVYQDTKGPGTDPVVEVASRLAGEPGAAAARDLAVVRLLFGQALRRGEVASLDLSHLDLKDGTMMILGKGKRKRLRVTLAEPTVAALKSWLSHRGQEPGPLILNFDKFAKSPRLTGNGIWRVTTKLGLGRPHGLRHAGITEGLDGTKDPRAVQRFSRHADLRTLMKYDDNRKDLGGDVAKAIGRRTARPRKPN